jgi:hypothetical protein
MPREYSIEFDILEGHNPNTGATIGEQSLRPYGWRSIGATRGGRFANGSGVTLVAISLKANKPGDTFKVIPEYAGRLFDTVWLKNDHTEVHFMDGNIPVSDGVNPDVGAFWMRVPRNDSADITACDRCHIASAGAGCLDQCPFTGQVFSSNPPAPTTSDWTKIKGERDSLNATWQSLMSACPSAFREIQAYGESPDGARIMFVSHGELLLYRAQDQSVSLLGARHTALSLVNHISFERDSFVLSKNGGKIQTVNPDQDKFIALGSPRGQDSKNA